MVRYRKLVYIIIFSFLATVANSKNPPPGTGTADVPANILIMLDDSGSMNARVRSSSALYYPTQVQTDSNGNMYILDYSYTRISKYDANGNFLKSFGRWGYGCEQWTNAWD